MSRKVVDINNYFELLSCASVDKKHIKKLAYEMGWSPTTMSKMVTALEKKGLVYKEFGGLYRYIKLTDKGRAILEMVTD